MTMLVELDASALSQAIKDIANTAGTVTTLGSHTLNEVFGPSRAADCFELLCRQKNRCKTCARVTRASQVCPEIICRCR